MQIEALLKDPVALAAGVILVLTVAVLVWALKMLDDNKQVSEEIPYDPHLDEQKPEKEDQGVLEARLQETCSQLGTLSQKIDAIEKLIREKLDLEKTISSLPVQQPGPDMEKLISKIEAKLETVSVSAQPGKNEDLERIETKLDSIRKLLVLLSDSGNPNG